MKRVIPSDKSEKLMLLFELGVAVFVIAAAFWLHASFLKSGDGLWRDEVSTVHVATLPTMGLMWNALVYESFPAMLYGILRFWVSVAGLTSDMAMRSLGFIIGILLVASLWVSGRQFARTIPIVSLALVALNPVVIRWGDSLRGYGLGSFCIVVACLMIWHVVESPSQWRVAGAAAVAVLSVQSLYQNAILLAAICLGGIVVCARKGLWKRASVVAAIACVAALSLLPYVPIIRKAREVMEVAESPTTLTHMGGVFAAALGAGGSVILYVWIALLLLTVGVSIYMMYRDRLPNNAGVRDAVLFCFTTAVAAFVGFLLFLISTNFPTQVWYYIPLIVLLGVAMEVILGSAAVSKAVRTARIVMVLFLVLISANVSLGYVSVRQTNVDLIAGVVKNRAVPDDLIVVNPWYCGVTFNHYYTGPAPWMTIPPLEDLNIHRYDLIKAKMISDKPIEPLFFAIEKTLRAGHRVWFVGALPFLPEGRTPPVLPPAPHSQWGWQGGPYIQVWTLQVAHFIQTHALRGEQVEVPVNQTINPLENLPLIVTQGWH